MSLKLRASMKYIKEAYPKIIGVPYCEAQNLLTFRSPFGYSCGKYGWNCDYYDVEGVCISTGYNFIEDRGLRQDVDKIKLLRKYEKEALENYDNKEKIEELLVQFVKEVI